MHVGAQVHDDNLPAHEGEEGAAAGVEQLDTKLLAMAEVLGYSRDKLSAHIATGASMYMSSPAVPHGTS